MGFNPLDMAEDAFDHITEKAEKFIEDPVGETVDAVTQPVRDGLGVLDGLSEGEIRAKAAARLGADVVSGMALGEVCDFLLED